MPALVMRAPAGSLLEQTNRLVVAAPDRLRRRAGVPWGISESAYNARDLELTYQYSNFGVPGSDSSAGCPRTWWWRPTRPASPRWSSRRRRRATFARLQRAGARGRYGFYEAVDFTPSAAARRRDARAWCARTWPTTRA